MSTTPVRRMSRASSDVSTASTTSNGSPRLRRRASTLNGTGQVGIAKAKAILSKRQLGCVPTPDYSKAFHYILFTTSKHDELRGSLKLLRNNTISISSSIIKPEIRKTMLDLAVCKVVEGILATLPTGGPEGVPAGSVDWAETPLGFELRAIFWHAKDEMTRGD